MQTQQRVVSKSGGKQSLALVNNTFKIYTHNLKTNPRIHTTLKKMGTRTGKKQKQNKKRVSKKNNKTWDHKLTVRKSTRGPAVSRRTFDASRVCFCFFFLFSKPRTSLKWLINCCFGYKISTTRHTHNKLSPIPNRGLYLL